MMQRQVLSVFLVFLASIAIAEEKKPPKITFDDQVRPILQQKCASCHNPDKKSSDLDLTNYSSLMQGGASGEVIDPGDAAASYLYKLVTHEDEPAMPPEAPKIADEMIEMLRKWIDGGVLENSGSVAKAAKKKKYDLALSAPSTERPAEVPMPARLSLQPVLFTPARTATDALATSPWAPLAAISSQKQVLLYNTQTLELLGVLPFPEGTPRVLKFSRNGGLLLCGGGVAGASGRVVVWNVRSGERIIELGDELDEVLAADISSDQTLIALAGPGRVVRIYATETGQLLHEIRKHTDWVTALEFSPDSVLLSTGDRNGGLQVWEGWTGREYLTLKGHTGGISAVSWRSDSNILASSSEDSTIRLWEMENGGQVKNWGAHGGGALSVEFTRDGRLFSCGRDRTPKTWDQNGAQQVAFEAFGDLALQATYCDETSRAISGDWNGEIRVWNSADGARVGQLVINVPMLENRLKEAHQMLVARQTESKPIAAAYQASQSAFEKISSDLTAAQQQSAQAKQKADAAAVVLTTSQAAIAKATAEQDAAKKLADSLSASVPVLKEAAEKATAAATQLPEDANLSAAAKTIRESAEAKAKQKEVAVADAAQKLAVMQQAQQAIAAAQKLTTETATALAVAQQSEQKLVPLLKPAEDAFNAAKGSFDQSNTAVESAKQAVARWTSEIEFDRKFTEFKHQRAEASAQLAADEEQLDSLQAAASEAESAVEKTRNELTDGQAALTKNETDYKSAIAAVEVAKQAQTAATEAKNVVINNVNLLSQVIAKLTEAVAKADEALAIAKEDPTLIAAANSIKAATAEKSKQLEAAKAELVTKTQAEQDAVTDVANNEQAAADLLAMQEPLKKKIAETTAAIAPLEKKSAEANQAVEAYTKTVTESQAKVEAISKSIADLQGLAQAG
jgi:WD40 repeat protein